MSTQEMIAIWDRIRADYRRDAWCNVAAAALSRTSIVITRDPRSLADMPTVFLFGVRVQLDTSMPVDQIKLIAADGSTVRIVNIGT